MFVCKIFSPCHVMPCQVSDNSRHDWSQRVFFPLKLLIWEMLEPNALLWDQGSQTDVLWCSSPASGAQASRSNTIDGVSMPYCMWRSWARFHLSSGGIVCGDDVATNKGGLPLLPRAGRVVVWPTWSKYKTWKNLQIQTNAKWQEKEKRLLPNKRAVEIWNF